MARQINCKEGRGSFFINSYKTEEQHPDYKGSINIEGTAEELALWVRCEDNDVNKQFLRCVCQETKATFILRPVQKDDAKKPDYKGNFDFNGKKYDVSGWINSTESGVTYVSLSISHREAGTGAASAPTGFPTFGNPIINTSVNNAASAGQETPSGTESADEIPF